MKKALFLPIIAVLIFFSCKKDHSASTPADAAKKYKVTFNVRNFKQTQGTFSVKQKVNALSTDTLTNLSGYLDILYFVVYNTSRDVFSVIQDSTMTDMGTITASLPPGNYTVIAVAGKKGLQLTNYDFEDSGVYSYGSYDWQDTFWGSQNLIVGTTDMNQDLTLSRAVGKIQLLILDNIPANADSMVMIMTPELRQKRFAQGFDYPGSSNGTVSLSVPIPASAKGHSGFTMEKIIGNGSDPVTVSITCKTAANSVIAHTVVTNVLNGWNIRSVLSGNLFSNPPGTNPQEFHVKADTAWSSTTINAGF